ncbi:MAG: LysR family transcriptional regulator [Burkholderiaceae bacterium]|nr:LysR family transcriptional regulator [Sulfuritalea sp.]MCF8175906.1 LysR family transcriptional regulator [Burkholderiaceae bacterium]MCF8183496.1 LysR family transcriptional regulator [Polynucleobacter sp.]
MKNVTLRQLKIFEAVARHLSFSRAAEELHLTQPAVSMQVQSLEDQAGLPLTEQAGKKVRLTAAGEELARQARHIAEQLREAGEALAALKGVEAGHLKIGVVSTAKYFAPSLLAEFRHRHPGVEMQLIVNNRGTIVSHLADNSIDLAIMGTPPNAFDTVAKIFADHPLVFIAAPNHPLAGKRHIDPKQLGAETLLIREPGSGTRSALERFLEEHKVTAGARMELGSNETIKQAVMAGLGLSFISEHTIGLERSVGRLVKLNVTGTPVKRQWRLVYRTDKRLMPAAIAFVDFMDSEGSRLIEALVGKAAARVAPSVAQKATKSKRRT